MIALPVLSVVLGYFIGSIPSAYLVGRLWGKIDLRQEGASHVSATAVLRKVGLLPFILTVAMDAGKGTLAVYAGTLFSSSTLIILATAYAAVIGHCWSVFIGFEGGLGAVVTYGVLGTLAISEFLIGAVVAIILFFTTHKSSLSTYILVATMSIALLLEKRGLVLGLFPLCLILVQLVKRFQVRKTSADTGYKNELFDDLKRLK